jgi:3-phenylpropionate/trans-cinnamate dioxygenase ferredoxin subunit
VRAHVRELDDIEPGTARRSTIPAMPWPRSESVTMSTAIGDRCTHEDVALCEGEVQGRQLGCWKHGSTFSVDTGAPRCLPATARTHRRR